MSNAARRCASSWWGSYSGSYTFSKAPSERSPSVAELAGALAEYGAALRRAAVQAGEPVLRPSQKRTAPRRKAK